VFCNNKHNILKHSLDELELLKVILSFILFRALSNSSIINKSIVVDHLSKQD